MLQTVRFEFTLCKKHILIINPLQDSLLKFLKRGIFKGVNSPP
jgi:hypothetical protein